MGSPCYLSSDPPLHKHVAQKNDKQLVGGCYDENEFSWVVLHRQSFQCFRGSLNRSPVLVHRPNIIVRFCIESWAAKQSLTYPSWNPCDLFHFGRKIRKSWPKATFFVPNVLLKQTISNWQMVATPKRNSVKLMLTAKVCNVSLIVLINLPGIHRKNIFYNSNGSISKSLLDAYIHLNWKSYFLPWTYIHHLLDKCK